MCSHESCSACAIDIRGLSDPHKDALRRFVDKFKQGALEHGDLKKGKKWTSDMLNEFVDATFYAIFGMLEIESEEIN